MFLFFYSISLKFSFPIQLLKSWRASDTVWEHSHKTVLQFCLLAHTVNLRQRSYRMCYLNHTNQTLHNFYYFVLLLRFSFFRTILFQWIVMLLLLMWRRLSVAVSLLLIRLLIPFDYWRRGTEIKEATSRAEQQQNNSETFLLTAFLMFRCMCSLIICSECSTTLCFNMIFGVRISCRFKRQHSITAWNEYERDSFICHDVFVRMCLCKWLWAALRRLFNAA